MAFLYTKNRARAQSAFLAEWQGFTKPALSAMVLAGLSLVAAMDTYRGGQVARTDVARHRHDLALGERRLGADCL